MLLRGVSVSHCYIGARAAAAAAASSAAEAEEASNSLADPEQVYSEISHA